MITFTYPKCDVCIKFFLFLRLHIYAYCELYFCTERHLHLPPPTSTFLFNSTILSVDPMTDILCRQNFFPSCKHVPHFTLAQYIFLFFTFPPTVAGLNGGKRNRRFLSTGHFNNLLQHVPVAHNGSLHKHVDIATDILLVDTLLVVVLISFFFMSTQH